MKSDCPHILHDPELRRWYAENPHCLCARCWLAGRIVIERASGIRLAFWKE